MITQQQIDVELYQQQGFLTGPAVFLPGQLEALRSEADRLLRLCTDQAERYAKRIEWEVDHLAAEQRGGMERVIRKLEPVSDLSPLYADFAFHPGVVDPMMQILDGPVELFEDKLNLKLPGGSPYPWHQDWVCCWRAHSDQLVTCFIYLDDADEVNGCLWVIPGSHIGKPMCPFKPGSRFEIDPAYVDQSKAVPVPLKAGEMIFFDPYLLHYSDLNRSSSPRRAIIYTYNPASLGKINEGRFPQDG
jgi:ectoine hydroxylase-related dioxygenase (phytanoyl-CoA dioxygenase family)